MNGSGIFAHDPKDASESDATTGLRYYQVLTPVRERAKVGLDLAPKEKIGD